VQQFSTRWVIPIVVLLFLLTPAFGENDPGHDTLYVLKLGDSNVTGTINISENLTATIVQATSRFFGPNLDLRGDGASSAATNQIIGTNTHLELSSTGELILNKAVTGGWVYIGWPGTTTGLNVTGQIIQQGVKVCLANGTNCPSTISSANLTGAGTANTLARWTTDADLGTSSITDDGTNIGIGTASAYSKLQVAGGINATGTIRQNNIAVCLSDGTNCPTGAAQGTSGWTNTTNGNTTLVNQQANVSAGTLFVDNTNGRVGMGTTAPTQKLHVNGSMYLSTGGVDALTITPTNGYYNLFTATNDIRFYVGSGNGVVSITSSSGGTSDRLDLAKNYIQFQNGGTAPSISVSARDVDLAAQNLTIYGQTAATDASTHINGGALIIRAGASAGAQGNGGNIFLSGGTNKNASNGSAGNIILAHNTSVSLGRVGIGTPNPTQKVDVNGSVNVSGNGNLSLQNGALQIGGVTTISSARVGTFATGTTVNAQAICLADGTNCLPISGANSAAGWRNDSGSGNISLSNTNANVSANTLFIDNTNGLIGIHTTTPGATLDLNASPAITNMNTTAAKILLRDTGAITGDVYSTKTGMNITAITNGTINDTGSLDLAGLRVLVVMNNTLEEEGLSQNVIVTGTRIDVNAAMQNQVVNGDPIAIDGADNYFVYGMYANVYGDIGTDINDGERVGGYFTTSGTHFANTGIVASATGASNNYGGRFDASGGSSNYGVYIPSPTAGANNYALFSSASAQNYFGGSVGIRDTTPTSTLTVSGNLSVSGSTNSSIDGSTLFIDATNNRIGIGTARPANTLEVVGTINATAIKVGNANVLTTAVTSIATGTFLTGGTITSIGTISLDSAALNTSYDARYAPIAVISTAGGWANTSTLVRLITNGTNVSIGNTTGTQPIPFVDATAGRVGIGTGTPSAILHVVGGETPGITLEQSTDLGATAGTLATTIGDGEAFLIFTSNGKSASIEFSNGLHFVPGTAQQVEIKNNTGSTHLFVNSTSGKVGIGTSNPRSTLHVIGEANISGISGDGTGKVVCIKSDGNLGTCSSAVGASGTCTCG